MHHVALYRSRPDDCNLDNEIIKAGRSKSGQHSHLRSRFDLEYTDGIGAADHVVDRGIFCWN